MRVEQGDLVITQPLTLVATCNAIAYCSAEPVFTDVDRHTLGSSPRAMDEWQHSHPFMHEDGVCRTRTANKVIGACLPMHTFGHPADLDGLVEVYARWGLALVEDAAESLGSPYIGGHTGTVGLGTLSFNGNKITTTGGDDVIRTDETLGTRANHLTTTANRRHPYDYVHDELGYKYRLPNLNAAPGCAQLERSEAFVANKRELAARYAAHFSGSDLQFVTEPEDCRSNYWPNPVVCDNRVQRDALLKSTNDAGAVTRPILALVSRLPVYAQSRQSPLIQAEWADACVVNLPSSVVPH